MGSKVFSNKLYDKMISTKNEIFLNNRNVQRSNQKYS